MEESKKWQSGPLELLFGEDDMKIVSIHIGVLTYKAAPKINLAAVECKKLRKGSDVKTSAQQKGALNPSTSSTVHGRVQKLLRRRSISISHGVGSSKRWVWVVLAMR
ncbi:unnamed protein product [Urochloa humidicola]